MSYVQSPVTVLRGITNGRRWWHFAFTESGVGPADEWVVNLATARNPDGSRAPVQPAIPHDGTFTLFRAALTGGQATVIAPKLGRVPNPEAGTLAYIAGFSPAAAHFNEAINVRYFCPASPPVIYGRSSPDAGTDATVETEFTLYEGHL